METLKPRITKLQDHCHHPHPHHRHSHHHRHRHRHLPRHLRRIPKRKKALSRYFVDLHKTRVAISGVFLKYVPKVI